MPRENIPHSLALIPYKHKFPYILEESGPIEACLKDLGNSLVQTKVSIISQSMAMVKETMDLIFQQTSLIYTISTLLVEQRLLSHIILSIG